MGIGTLEFPSTITIACTFFLLLFATAQEDTQFIFNGFKGSINNLHVDGLAKIKKNGLLQLTDFTKLNTSHVFYKNPVTFGRNHLSFSTTFVFAMHPQITNHSGHGIAFVICPSLNLHSIATGQSYLGLFNTSSNGLKSNHVFAVELDTMQNAVFNDIDDNHVGIDVNSLVSVYPASASYYSDKKRAWKTLRLTSGKPMQVWIDYDGIEKMINVTISPIDELKPSKSLLSKHLDLSNILVNSMYVGFSSATGVVSNYHFILGWSWNQSGPAQNLDISKLPSLPKFRKHWSRLNRVIVFVMLSMLSLVVLMIGGVSWIISRKKYDELEEPWEQIYRPHRYSYKDLFIATKGFKDTELLGVGGFGKVYKGELGSTGVIIAVKRVSHDSRQGMREFVAEVASMRRLTHRNLVQLLGYCRRKGELLLVYEYMINGSLDKLLFTTDDKSELCWFLRFKIIKGIASALLYLHEEWEQTVIHRDVKASNVLLDAEMNARLGDFGLARLYDHNTDPRTTHLVGTMGYIAPEANRTRVPSTKTDVFAFLECFLFEVGCGRRPIDPHAEEAEDVILVDWVYDCWKKGAILKASDPKLKEDYVKSEMEVVLRLGLLCSNPKAEARPTMRQVVQYLHHGHNMPDIPSDYNPKGKEFFVEGFGASSSLPSSSSQTFASENVSISYTSSTNSILQCGR